jgi:hypothetical protein
MHTGRPERSGNSKPVPAPQSMSQRSYFGGLTYVDPPGRSYLSTNFGPLYEPPPGTGFDLNDYFRSLATEPVGRGENGGPVAPQYSGVLNNNEDYVSIHLPVATAGDGTHVGLLYKDVLTFVLRDVPNVPKGGAVPHNVVPLNWLNIFLTTRYNDGLSRYREFVSDFMGKHGSHFMMKPPPDSSGSPSDVADPDLPEGGGRNGLASLYRMPLEGASARPSQGSAEGTRRTPPSDPSAREGRMMTEFVNFVSDHLPPEEYLLSERGEGLRWLSTRYSEGPAASGSTSTAFGSGALEERYAALVRTLDAMEGQHPGLKHFSGDRRAEAEDASVTALNSSLGLMIELKTRESMRTSSGRGGGGGGNGDLDAILVPMRQHQTGDAYGQEDLKKLLEQNKGVEKTLTTMIGAASDFFRKPMIDPRVSHMDLTPNGVPYLLRCGIRQSWQLLGVANTVFDDTSRAHAYKRTVASHPLVKVVVQREQETFNIWGADLSQGTSLYLVLRRRPNFRISADPPQTSDGKASSRGGIPVPGPLDSDPLDRARAAWQDYGPYEYTPAWSTTHLGRGSLATHVNLLGREEHPLVLLVGMVKYDFRDDRYNYSTRNLALGIPNPRTGHVPTLDEAKKAMMSLPKITILVRMN